MSNEIYENMRGISDESIKALFDRLKEKQHCNYDLGVLFYNSGIKAGEVIKNISFSRSQFYKIINNESKPSKDVLLDICIALKLEIDIIQALLTQYEYSQLQFKRYRDFVIIYGILKKLSRVKINILLSEHDNIRLINDSIGRVRKN